MNPQSVEGRKPNHGSVRRFMFMLVCTAVLAFNNAAKLAAQESAEQPTFIDPSTLKFESVPRAPGCLTVATLRGDPGKGPSMLMEKLAAGCKVPWHWHSPNEYLVVLKGTLRLEMREAKTPLLHSGGYAFMPAHHVHQGGCPSACTVFAYRDGVWDTHYVDITGKEIPFEEALKGLQPATPPKRKQ